MTLTDMMILFHLFKEIVIKNSCISLIVILLTSCQETDLEQILVPVTEMQIVFYQDSVKTSQLDKVICNWFSSNYLSPEVSDSVPKKFDGQLLFSRRGKVWKTVEFSFSPPVYQYQVEEQVFTKRINTEGLRFLELAHKYPNSGVFGN